MRFRGFIVGALALVGLVWIGQGLGIFPGSGFMDGDVTWAAIGAVMVVAAIAIAVWTVMRRRPA